MNKETKELFDAVLSLWESDNLRNKELALAQLYYFEIPKAKFIFEFIKSKWSKRNIINN